MLITVRALMLAIAAISATQPAGQAPKSTAADSAQSKNASAVIDELIERTNKLDAFVARYHMTTKDGEELELRLVFQAPDQAKLTIAGDKVSLRTCINDGSIDFGSTVAGETPLAGTFVGAEEAMRGAHSLRDRFQAAFPDSSPREDVDGGVGFEISIQPADERGNDSVSFTLVFRAGRFARLGWLDHVRDLTPVGGDGSEHITYALTEETRFTLSRESGFFERLEKVAAAGSRSKIQLEELELQPKLSESEFLFPARAPGARDISEAMRSKMLGLAFDAERRSLHEALKSMVEEHRLEWDEAAALKLKQVLRGAQADYFRSMLAPWLDTKRAWIEQCATGLDSKLAALDASDEGGRRSLKLAVAEQRAMLESALDKALEGYLARLSSPIESGEASELGRDVARIEKEMSKVAFEESIAKPLLQSFDEKVANQI